jgi:hypothetical protein
LAETIEEDSDNYGSIRLYVPSGVTAPTAARIPVEGRGYDSDGVPVDFLLHVLNGVANELEVIKADGTQIITDPDPRSLDVFIH